MDQSNIDSYFNLVFKSYDDVKAFGNWNEQQEDKFIIYSLFVDECWKRNGFSFRLTGGEQNLIELVNILAKFLLFKDQTSYTLRYEADQNFMGGGMKTISLEELLDDNLIKKVRKTVDKH